MRPVNKGVSPSESFLHYRDAAQSLIDKLGSYCSYCERHIETHLAVEHVSPKSVDPDRESDWDNFLLACVNCNSSKGQTSTSASEYLWPHLDNTLKNFSYLKSLVVSAPDQSFEQRQKADALIRLVGLDRYPGNPDKNRWPSNSDNRWIFRKDLWDFATRARERLRVKNSPELREQIVETALSRGGFGIWYTVFAGDEDMRQRLISAFPGTAKYYFGQFGDLAVPVHVLRVLAIISEEIIHSFSTFHVKVVVPETNEYKRIELSLIPIKSLESLEGHQELVNLNGLSVWISMIEYPAIPTISRHKITVVVFEQRGHGTYSITKTRNYVEPSYEGKCVTGITFRKMALVGKDINNFFATAKPPH